MAGLRFKIAELERETKSLKTMGTKFFDSQSSWALDQFSSELQSIGGTRGDSIRTLELQCLRTTPSMKYESGSKQGGKKIYAAISGTWELRPLGKRPAPGRKVEFCGNASTRIELYASDEPKTRLAMWRLELGAADSPGCYVHAQILGDSDETPFPRSVPIPRLPSIFVTPMSAVEFVLGELFQDEWAKVTARNTSDAQQWQVLQRKRLQSLFSWYQGELKNSGSSPWMALKEAKPRGDIFTQN